MPRMPHPRTALSGYADARLPAWRRAVVGHHLRGCTRCAVEVGQIQGLGALLRATPPPVAGPPDALVDRLLAIGDPPVDAPGVPQALAGGHARPSVGATSMFVAAVVLVGTVGTGAVVTGVPLPWPSSSTRATVDAVLTPRLWPGAGEPDAAVSVRPVDNRVRP